MLHAMALVTFSLNKIVGILPHSLKTDGINHTAQDTFTRKVKFDPTFIFQEELN